MQAQHRQSQTAMLSALQKYFPPSASWTVPNGGTFLWVQMPAVPMAEIYHKALSRGVFVAEGTPFFPGQQGYPALRLNFTLSPEKIERGISVLGELVQAYLSP